MQVIGAAGGAPQQLSRRTDRVYEPYAAWSPDGARLVVMSYEYPTDDMDLYAVSWPGKAWTRLTHTPSVDETFPMWTPDGRNVVFMGQATTTKIVSVNVANVLPQLTAAASP